MRLFYVACPYTHKNKDIQDTRVDLCNRYVSRMIQQNHQAEADCVFFSPLTNSIVMINYGVANNWDIWKPIDFEFLGRCDALIVLCLPGWKSSVGVRDEILEAERLGIKIIYETNAVQALLPELEN